MIMVPCLEDGSLPEEKEIKKETTARSYLLFCQTRGKHQPDSISENGIGRKM